MTAIKPKRGEVWELNGQPVLVVSPERFNAATGFAWVLLIQVGTSNNLALPLPSSATTEGAVLVHQISVVDLTDAQARLIEALPDTLVQDVLTRARLILS